MCHAYTRVGPAACVPVPVPVPMPVRNTYRLLGIHPPDELDQHSAEAPQRLLARIELFASQRLNGMSDAASERISMIAAHSVAERLAIR